MRLKVKTMDLDAAGKMIIILNKTDADALGVFPLDRVILKKNGRSLTVVVNTSTRSVKRGSIITYGEVSKVMMLKNGDIVSILPREELVSKQYIDKKIHGSKLNKKEILEIVKDTVKRNLNDLELAAFITALEVWGLDDEEVAGMSEAIVKTGKTIDFGDNVLDKHSIGGVPGDKTSLIVVPIIAAAGYKIPKTASRSITDPAGTADRMEMLASVCFDANHVKKIVNKTGACIVWGGAVDLSPADDLFIEIEHPLNLDPLLMPSVISKKKAVGSDIVVIDIPTGPEAKVKNMKAAYNLGKSFVRLGKILGIKVDYVITDACQPLGYAMGPALEAREVLNFYKSFEPNGLLEKVLSVSGKLLEMAGNKNGKAMAEKILRTGMAEKKFREIIKAQGGNPNIAERDIRTGKLKYYVKSGRRGKVKKIHIKLMKQIARAAGAPEDKGAGILLNKKIDDIIKKNELLYTIFAEKMDKLRDAIKIATSNNGFDI